MALGPEKPKEIAEPAAQIDHGAVAIFLEKTQKLFMPALMGVGPIPVHALWCWAVLSEFCGVISRDLGQNFGLSDVRHRGVPVSAGEVRSTKVRLGAAATEPEEAALFGRDQLPRRAQYG